MHNPLPELIAVSVTCCFGRAGADPDAIERLLGAFEELPDLQDVAAANRAPRWAVWDFREGLWIADDLAMPAAPWATAAGPLVAAPVGFIAGLTLLGAALAHREPSERWDAIERYAGGSGNAAAVARALLAERTRGDFDVFAEIAAGLGVIQPRPVVPSAERQRRAARWN